MYDLSESYRQEILEAEQKIKALRKLKPKTYFKSPQYQELLGIIEWANRVLANYERLVKNGVLTARPRREDLNELKKAVS